MNEKLENGYHVKNQGHRLSAINGCVDSYMAVCDLPQRCVEHPKKLAVCAKKFYVKASKCQNLCKFQMPAAFGQVLHRIDSSVLHSMKTGSLVWQGRQCLVWHIMMR